jgi:hypothetical protein
MHGRLRGKMVFVLTACVLGSLCSAQDSPSITPEDILNIWRDQDARVEDFLLDFDLYERTTDESDGAVSERRENVVLLAKDNLFRTRQRVFEGDDRKKVTSDFEYSADGQREYFCSRLKLDGLVETKLPEQCAIQHRWAIDYLNCVQKMPRKKGNKGFECNLIGALDEDKRIEVSEGVFDGRKVVILIRPGHSRIYLDPERNYAVLGGEATGSLTFKYRNSDFVEVCEGVWMPRQTEKTFRDGSRHILRRTKVNVLKVNNGYQAADFRIQFEPGIRVLDLDLNMQITPSAKQFDPARLERIVRTADKENFIDVYHAGEANDNRGRAGPNTPPATNGANPAMTGAVGDPGGSHSWQKIATLVALTLTGFLVVLLYLRGRGAKATEKDVHRTP